MIRSDFGGLGLLALRRNRLEHRVPANLFIDGHSTVALEPRTGDAGHASGVAT